MHKLNCFQKMKRCNFALLENIIVNRVYIWLAKRLNLAVVISLGGLIQRHTQRYIMTSNSLTVAGEVIFFKCTDRDARQLDYFVDPVARFHSRLHLILKTSGHQGT